MYQRLKKAGFNEKKRSTVLHFHKKTVIIVVNNSLNVLKMV